MFIPGNIHFLSNRTLKIRDHTPRFKKLNMIELVLKIKGLIKNLA